jgi:putative two-component system response regulator
MTTILEPAAVRNDASTALPNRDATSTPQPQSARSAKPAKPAKLMVVDDEPTNVKLVQRFLELDGYERFVTTTDSRRAVQMAREERPDCILLDLMMPHVSGLEILDQLRADPELALIPVIFLTAVTDGNTRRDALERGATDFLNKPIDPYELAPRVANVVAAKAFQDQLLGHSRDLEQAVRERTVDLERAHREVAYCLARAAEYRDNDTGFHVLRVGRYARLIAEELGMTGDQLDLIEHAAQLHDVGKIGVPDAVLLKPDRLTEEEFLLMKKHCGFGKRILRQASDDEEIQLRSHSEVGAKILDGAASPLLVLARKIALSHHEWWNGAGYPLGLRGEDIPLEGRITAVADVFDALSSKRCYKDAMPVDECFEIMERESGTHFDPKVFAAFLNRRKQVVEVQLRYADEE